MREKFIELAEKSLRHDMCGETVNIVSNGVTLATDNNVGCKWIPVTEPPKENGYYLCVLCVSSVNQRKEYRRVILFWEDNVWIDMANCFRTKKPLCWMPLPEPPKGE